eukprot:scaffold17271_cov69-Cyclotella_meneghiniana.AAC.3
MMHIRSMPSFWCPRLDEGDSGVLTANEEKRDKKITVKKDPGGKNQQADPRPGYVQLCTPTTTDSYKHPKAVISATMSNQSRE